MEELSSARLLLVQTPGPTSFVVKSPDSDKKHKVTIGDIQKCTCPEGSGTGLCLHIFFVMMKVLRVPQTNPLVWQRSLTDREIETVLQMRFAKRPKSSAPKQQAARGNDDQPERREVEEGDICPICQEEMKNTEALTYCRDGCRQSIHAKCMSIWVEHQSKQPEVKCPFCRVTWSQSSLDLLAQEMKATRQSNSVACCSCRCFPIQGAQYRCLKCKEFNMCEACFDKGHHQHHPFVSKANPANKASRWVPAPRQAQTVSVQQALPDDVIRSLQERELTVEDYDTLLQLDQGPQKPSLAQYLVESMEPAPRSCIKNDDQCPYCGDDLLDSECKVAPCGHVLHSHCAAASFNSLCFRCPTDNKPIFIGLASFKKKAKSTKDQLEPDKDSEPNLEAMEGGLELCGVRLNETESSTEPALCEGASRRGVCRRHRGQTKLKSMQRPPSGDTRSMADHVIGSPAAGVRSHRRAGVLCRGSTKLEASRGVVSTMELESSSRQSRPLSCEMQYKTKHGKPRSQLRDKRRNSLENSAAQQETTRKGMSVSSKPVDDIRSSGRLRSTRQSENDPQVNDLDRDVDLSSFAMCGTRLHLPSITMPRQLA